MSKDPIGESGGPNECAYVYNSPIDDKDAIGLWKNAGDETGDYAHYQAEDTTDTLRSLAALIGQNAKDWQCLWPVRVSDPNRYPEVSVCDVYDVANVWSTHGKSLYYYVETKNSFQFQDWADAVFGTPTTYLREPRQLARNIISESGEGKTPISLLYTAGHGGAGDFRYWHWHLQPEFKARPMYGYAGYARAQSGKGPPRCWFTRTAQVDFWGCGPHSAELAGYFAKNLLRKGGTTAIFLGGTTQAGGFARPFAPDEVQGTIDNWRQWDQYRSYEGSL